MFRLISPPNWTFVLILYTTFFLEVHAVSDTCSVCSCSQDGRVDCTLRGLKYVPLNIPPNTKRLHLDHNSITDVPSGAFQNLQSLLYLNLYSNNIINISSGAFEHLWSLQELDLERNSITDVPSGAFQNLQSLLYLNLARNNITNISSGAFDRLQILQDLNLGRNDITNIPSGAFEHLKSLQTLDLAGNYITNIPSGAFQHLKSLQYLYIHSNNIKNIPTGVFEHLQSLQSLYLSSNKITNIPSGAFEHLQSLQELDLSSNNIGNIPSGAFEHLKSLRVLYLSSNKITNIPSGAFEHLQSLKELELVENNITNIPSEAFENLQSLQDLLLNGNRIKNYEDGAFLFLPSISIIDLTDNKDIMCGCHLPALVKYMKNNYKRNVDVKGECQTDLGQKLPILSYSQCTNYSLFQRNLQCQTCSGMMCNDSEVTVCPGPEPVCRLTLSTNGGALKYERSCSNYTECVEAMRNNIHTCNKSIDSTSCTGCCVGNSCNKEDFKGWTKSIEFHLILKKLNDNKSYNEYISRTMDHGLTQLTGTFKVQYCSGERGWSIFTIYCWIPKETNVHDLRLSIKRVLTKIHTLPGFRVQKLELLHGRFCNENTTSNNGTFYWPVTKVGTNVTIPCHANVATRYCSPRAMNNLDIKSSQYNTPLQCSPFSGIWQEPNMSKCNNTEWITQRLKNIKQDIDQGKIGDISKEVLNVSQKSVYFKKQDIDLAVDILERMVPFMSTVNNTLLIINNMINTPENVLIEAEKAKGSVSRMLNIIEKIPETISLEEQQVTVSYSNLGIGVAKVNKDTNGLSYGVSYGTYEIEAKTVLYHQSCPDPQQADIETIAFISIPKSLPKYLTERSALSRVSFVSLRNDKLYRVKQISGTSTNSKIYSYVLGAHIPNVLIGNLDEPVNISFSLINKNDDNLKCVFWDTTQEKNSYWSTKGCKISKNEPGREITCSCKRLTSFALLMDVHQTKDDDKNHNILQIMSNIGCVISFVFLLLTIAVHVHFKYLRNLNTSKIVVNLSLSLAVINLIFLVRMQLYGEALGACKAMAALLHFFLLVAFMWMAAEAIHTFLINFVAFKIYETSYMKIIAVLAWCLPVTAVTFTLVMNLTDNYVRTREVCWLTEAYFFTTFLAPAVIVLICNLIMVSLVIWFLRSTQNELEYERRKERVIGIVGLFFIFGLPWVLIFFAVEEAAESLKYLFAIFSALQGAFIFGFFCIYKKETRNVIVRCFSRRKTATSDPSRGTRSGNEEEDNTRETNF